MRGQILVVDHATPAPDRDSGSASAFVLLRILTRAGFGVTFAPMFLTHDGSYTDALNALGVRTLAAPQWTSLDAVIDAFAPRSDVIVLSRAPVASKLYDRIRRMAPAAKILFDTVDLHFLRMEREAALNGSRADAEEARRMREVELGLVRRADATTVVSSYEHRLLRKLMPRARVHWIPVMREIPTGAPATVEHNRWQALQLPRMLRRLRRPLADHVPGFDTRRDVVFVGSYGHRPNVDGILWFCREVWPQVLRRGFPGRFIVVGPEVPRTFPRLLPIRSRSVATSPILARCSMRVCSTLRRCATAAASRGRSSPA